jgi:hypothetical protein
MICGGGERERKDKHEAETAEEALSTFPHTIECIMHIIGICRYM